MQVDTTQLRTAAALLRQEVIKPLAAAQDRTGWPAGAFDSYTGYDAYGEAGDNWEREVDVIRQAAWELADKLEATADEYDAADTTSAQRLTARR